VVDVMWNWKANMILAKRNHSGTKTLEVAAGEAKGFGGRVMRVYIYNRHNDDSG
jgi:hypothetical protein